MANHLKIEKKVAVIHALAEGASIRAIERMTGVNQNTIMALNLRVGAACAAIMDEKMRELPCRRIEVDEAWGFIGVKARNVKPRHKGLNYGDIWVWIALDADSKLIPAFVVGKRDMYHARTFIDDLASRLKYRVQLSSDALNVYGEAVERGFGSEIDYGQIVKTYSVTNLSKAASGRYSPAEVIEVKKTVVNGKPDVRLISTSHVEKQNHTLRMHCRRLSRLTNAFSKRLESFKAAVALNFVYYNFVKTHRALKMTPAMAAGIESSHWTVAQLLERCGE